MKKRIIIFSAAVAILSLMAFGVLNINNSKTCETQTIQPANVALNSVAVEKVQNRIYTDFIYDVGTRFNPIKKSDLDAIRSFDDLIGAEHAGRIVEFNLMKVIVIINDKHSDIQVTGKSGNFNAAQLKLLQSLDYSTNLKISADYQESNKETGKIESSQWTPHLTIVPEIQAEYTNGKKALMEYLKENGKAAVAEANVVAEKLKPAKLFFTVTKNGTIENVRLDRSSNYPLVDERMIELITKTQGKWLPAENSEGEKVNQELVVSFGLMGC